MVDDGRTDDGRTPDHGHPISSPCEPDGSGELKRQPDMVNRRNKNKTELTEEEAISQELANQLPLPKTIINKMYTNKIKLPKLKIRGKTERTKKKIYLQ